MATMKTLAAKTKTQIGLGQTKLDLDNVLGEKTIYLKRNEVVTLPLRPEPIETVIHFSTKKYRFGKSPVIEIKEQRVAGDLKEKLVVARDIDLGKKTDFYMQYTGPDIGWIILF